MSTNMESQDIEMAGSDTELQPKPKGQPFGMKPYHLIAPRCVPHFIFLLFWLPLTVLVLLGRSDK